MKVISQTINVDRYYTELANIVHSPIDNDALIFIDTNILTWILRMDKDSFRELARWLDTLIIDKVLVIPIWTIHEYNALIAANSDVVFSPHKKRLKALENELRFFIDTARLIVDNEFCKKTGYVNKKDFIDKTTEEIDLLVKKIKSLTEKNNSKVENRRKYIEKLINNSKSEIKLNQLMSNIADFEFRFRSIIPPGFEDSAKATNRYGDVLIWKDILLTSKGRDSKKCLFLSLDLKKDWVFNPQKVLINEKEFFNNSNQRYYQPHPWLEQEYFDYTAGKILFSDIKTLAEVLYSPNFNFSNFANYKNLAKSINIELKNSETDKIIEWLVVNGHKLEFLRSTICKWERDPGEVDLNDLKEWCMKNVKSIIDWKHVKWGDVFTQFFI